MAQLNMEGWILGDSSDFHPKFYPLPSSKLVDKTKDFKCELIHIPEDPKLTLGFIPLISLCNRLQKTAREEARDYATWDNISPNTNFTIY